MSIKAAELSKSGPNSRVLDSIIRDHINIIDQALLRHGRTWGRNVVRISLPTQFGIPGMDPSDQQLIVYSNIVRSFETRKFEVAIVLEEDHTELLIAWTTALYPEEKAAMSAIIHRALLRPGDIDEFIETGKLRGSAVAGKDLPDVRMPETRIMTAREGAEHEKVVAPEIDLDSIIDQIRS